MSTRSSRERIVRNCLTDEGRPLEVGLQERTSNRLSAAVDKSHGRERGRKRLGLDRVRYQARREPQGNLSKELEIIEAQKRSKERVVGYPCSKSGALSQRGATLREA